MPSHRRSSSRLRSSAAKKIQKRFKSRKRLRSKASRKIQTRYRGFKTRKVMKRVKTNMLTDNNCSICLEPMINNVATALPCGHRFHKNCIVNWLSRSQGKCPNCKQRITNIPYPSTTEPQRQVQPLFQIQPLIHTLDLEPLQLIQHLIVRSQELDIIEQSIAQQRQLLPDAPEIPNITYEHSVFNEVTANDTETTLISLYNEAYNIYTNYESFNTQDGPSTNDEIAEQYIDAVFNRTSNLLEVARYDTINAQRICNHIGDIEFAEYM
jgi:Ring finger domain